MLIFLPFVGAVVMGFIPSDQKNTLKLTALFISLTEALAGVLVSLQFKNTGVIDQFLINLPWIDSFNAHYLLGVDGVSLMLILLTTFTLPLALIGTWNSIQHSFKTYFVCLLLLETGLVGTFASLDLFLFYVFWELTLIPMYFIIGIWGGPQRVYATLKFVIYTMAGSVLLLIAILYLYFHAGNTFNLLELYNYRLAFSAQCFVFAFLAIAFAVKIPLFPLHTWLPDAHVQAPTMGSVILAGILLKMGTYGFFRFGIPLCPDAIQYFQDTLMLIAMISALYGALVCLAQTDIKKVIAYSSVSHMGIVMLGLFSLTTTGMTGGLYQMFNHAVSTGSLFLLAGMLYERSHTLAIPDHSGLAKSMPLLAFFFILSSFSAMAVPLTGGFVGEFLSLLGSFQVKPVLATLATISLVISAVYMLWLIERVFLGSPKREAQDLQDLNSREIFVMIVLTVLIFWMGVFPKDFLQTIERSTETILYKLDDERTTVYHD